MLVGYWDRLCCLFRRGAAKDIRCVMIKKEKNYTNKTNEKWGTHMHYIRLRVASQRRDNNKSDMTPSSDNFQFNSCRWQLFRANFFFCFISFQYIAVNIVGRRMPIFMNWWSFFIECGFVSAARDCGNHFVFTITYYDGLRAFEESCWNNGSKKWNEIT